MGDVKTNTARFPKEELAQLVGPESGDWGVMTTEITLEDSTTLSAYGIGHRRGGAVHTFISIFGKSTLGKPQAHKDDDLDADTGFLIARKCPEILNDATLAQPKIDATNKKRQFELAFERRFRTMSFPFRLFCSLHLGQSVVDAYKGHNYLNATAKLEWNEAMRRAAYAMIHNKLDGIAAGEFEPDDLFELPIEKPGSSKRAPKVDKDNYGHQCASFKFVDGYPLEVPSKKQQWCIVCRQRKVTTACVCCTNFPLVFAIHQPGTKGYSCWEDHCREPERYAPIAVTDGPKKRAAPTPAKTPPRRHPRGTPRTEPYREPESEPDESEQECS